MTGREPGTRTEDLSTARYQPDQPGNPLRRTAQRYIVAGSALLVTTILLALTAWIITSGDVWADTKSHFFAELGLIIAALAGSGLVASGASRRSAAEVLDRTVQLDAAADRARRRLDQIAGQVHELSAQSTAQHEKLCRHTEEYGPMVRGMLDNLAAILLRLENIEGAMEGLAEQLPDELVKEHWRGHNRAVKEGFTGLRTGTDSAPLERPPHLGLVRPPDLGKG